MKNNFLTGFLTAIIICLSVSATLYFSKSDKLQPRKVFVDTHKTELANYKKLTELKEKQLVQSEGVIFSLQNKLNRYDNKLTDQKQRADSLEQAYNSNKTIAGCDSTIAADKAVIATQSNKLNDYKVLVNECSNTIGIFKDLDKTNKLMIDRQDKTIQAQAVEIDANSCCRQWFVNHPFWRWLHGVKCK